MVLKIVKMKTSKKIPFKNKNAKNINFYTGNILEDSRTRIYNLENLVNMSVKPFSRKNSL